MSNQFLEKSLNKKSRRKAKRARTKRARNKRARTKRARTKRARTKQTGGSLNNNSFLGNLSVIGKDIFSQMKDLFILWLVVPIVFGTLVPAFPFFIVLAILHGIFKYLIKTSLYNLQ